MKDNNASALASKKILNILKNSRFFSFLLTVSLLLLSIIFWTNISQQVDPLADVLAPLDNVAFINNDFIEPTFELTELTTVKLPHSTRLKDQFIWYIADFSVESSRDLWAVYIADKNWNLTVFVNGKKIGRADDRIFNRPTWRTPFIASFSSAQLQPTNNQLAIRIDAPNALTYLSPIYIGDYDLLTRIYNSRTFISVSIQQIIALFIWLTFLLALTLSIKRKYDSVYFWFTITTLMWAIHATIKLIPVPHYMNFEFWRFVMNASLLWFVVAAFLFTSRTVNKKNKRFEIGIFSAACLFQLTYILIQNIWPQYYTYFAIFGFMIFIVLVGMLSFYRLISSFYHSSHLFFLTLCTILVINIGVHDYLLLISVIEGSALLQFTAPILIVLFLAQLISRFVDSLQQKEAILHSFGIPSSSSRKQKVINWQEVKESERLKNVSQERQRIKQELHDGVSGSLVSVISSLRMGKSQSQQMLVSLEECMSELRSVFDKDNECEQNLAALMGMFRHKIEAKLKMLDISLQWSVFELADDIELDVVAANHVLRIVQECFTNIIKHSQASQVLLYAKSEVLAQSSVVKINISIDDNGAGCNELNARGNGLTNMRERAHQLGGDFIHVFSQQGSSMRLNFEIAKDA